MTRREYLIATTSAAIGAWLATCSIAQSTTSTAAARRYRISAADWMLLKRQKLGALQTAHDCGLDGVEVDMGPLGTRPDFDNKLLDEQFRKSYLESAGELGLEISSLAMSAFYGQSFAKHPSAEGFAKAWVDLMPKVGARVGFVPVIARANPKEEDPEGDAAVQRRVVDVFKRLAPLAEKAGVIVGISTELDSAANKRLLDEVGSPAVRIAYNVGEAIDAGRDVYKELSILGGNRIAEIVPTLSDGVLLKDDKRIDVPRLKATVDELNWSGWLVLQRSRDATRARDVKYNFTANADYLRSVFQA